MTTASSNASDRRYITYDNFEQDSPLLVALERIGDGRADLQEAHITSARLLRTTPEDLLQQGDMVARKVERIWPYSYCEAPSDGNPLSLFKGNPNIDAEHGQYLHRALRDEFEERAMRVIIGHNFDDNIDGWVELYRRSAAYMQAEGEVKISAEINMLSGMLSSTRQFGEHVKMLCDEKHVVAPASWWLQATTLEKLPVGTVRKLASPDGDAARAQLLGRFERLLTPKR